jgi:hypothetical protein
MADFQDFRFLTAIVGMLRRQTHPFTDNGRGRTHRRCDRPALEPIAPDAVANELH